MILLVVSASALASLCVVAMVRILTGTDTLKSRAVCTVGCVLVTALIFSKFCYKDYLYYKEYIVAFQARKATYENMAPRAQVGTALEVMRLNGNLAVRKLECEKWYNFMCPDEIMQLEPIRK